jgi:archaeal flagellar protein FlaJ
MKSTKYSKFCTKVFGKIFLKNNKDHIEEKNITLARADIAMEYDIYYSAALMNTIIFSISSLIFVLLLYTFLPVRPLLSVIIIPALVTLCTTVTYLYLPKYLIKKRERKIDLFLPYAVNFISSMSVAGVSPAEIFQSLSSIKMYGEIQKEAKKIAKEIKIMGIDSITAIKHTIVISPSKKFRAFLQGIVGTIQSGSDLHSYLSNIADKYMQDDLAERKKDLDILSVIIEVFVISVIALPIFFVIILTVMGFFGGSMNLSLIILMLFSFVILPVAYLGFYLLIRSTSIEEINKIRSERNYSIRKYYKENRKPLLILFISVGSVALFYMTMFILGYYGYLHPDLYLYFDTIFLATLFIIGPVAIYNYTQTKKQKQIQERLPEFLVEIGDSLSTGMTIFEAIKVAEKGHYGKLEPKIKKMKTQLSWNVSVKDVFNEFAEKMKSAIIHRIVITINRGLMMGGSTPKVFKAAAREVDQINQLEDQRKKNMSIYTIAILLCFFVFLAIILILNKTVFSSFYNLQTNYQIQQIGGPIAISKTVDFMQLQYVLFSFVFVQSIGAGVLTGFMMDGKLSSGVRYSCVLGLISFFIFKLFF